MHMHTRGDYQILSKRIIASGLHVDELPVARFSVPNDCADKKGDFTIEVFLVIAIFTLMSCFRLVFERFRDVLVERTSSQAVWYYLSPRTFLNSKKVSVQLESNQVPA
jgi:hypothetical protein